MDARTHNLNTVFGQERRHEVPLYQRPYVWEREKQWAPLWEDVRNLADRALERQPLHGHFMGAIVMEAQPSEYGRTDSWLVIDGQQRLTTLQLLLAAVRDVSRESQGNDHQQTKALVSLTANEDLIQHPDDRFKVWPTNRDREDFKLVLSAAGHAEVLQELATLEQSERAAHKTKVERHHRIVEAYRFFFESVKEWLSEPAASTDDRLTALLEVLRKYIQVVVIELAQKDDAQVIFETLNARGTPLLPADLVKSFLLREIERRDGDVKQAYEKYWKRFDDEENGWREQVLQGRQQRARIDLFLQHYLTLRTRDEVPVSRVYDRFREWAEKEKTFSPLQHLAEFAEYADIYAKFDSLDRHRVDGRFFDRLGYLEMSTAQPLLLELFRRFGGPVDAVARQQILADLESFLIRRLVCRLNTRGYNKLFLELLNVFNADAVSTATAIRAQLLSSQADSSRWPDDGEFEAAWRSLPAYRALARGRVRMVLEAIEDTLTTSGTERIQVVGLLTVEHIMPQKWPKHWPLPPGDPTAQAVEREELIHTFGNLTLLTGELNAGVSNAAWDVKRPEVRKKSRLLLNHDVTDEPSWDEKKIRARTLFLFKEAAKIWPKAATPASAGASVQ